jgi:predicted lipoprotein with Yx(FWY)xxD motif
LLVGLFVDWFALPGEPPPPCIRVCDVVPVAPYVEPFRRPVMQRIPRHVLAGVIVLTAGGGVGAYAVSQVVSSGPTLAAAAVMAVPTVTVTTLPAPTPTPAPAKPVLRLRAQEIEKHGTVVVDGAGLTLYRSDKDSAAPPASKCVNACLDTWKPVLVDDAQLTFGGLESTAVGTITRAGGKAQVTLGGWPLYRFVGDKKPGDIAGQCKGGFFAVTPTGGKSM